MSDSEVPPAVSSLRSKFEQMATSSSSSTLPISRRSRPRSLSNADKEHPDNESNRVVSAGTTLGVPVLRSSPSSPDLKNVEKIKPAPPPPRGSRASSPQVPSRESPSPTDNSRISAPVPMKKPPPPPPGSKPWAPISDADIEKLSHGGVATLKSKFNENANCMNALSNGRPSVTQASVSTSRSVSALVSPPALPARPGNHSPIKGPRSSFPLLPNTQLDSFSICSSPINDSGKEDLPDPLSRQPPPIPSRNSDPQSKSSTMLRRPDHYRNSSESTSSNSSTGSDHVGASAPALPLRRMPPPPPPIPQRRNVSDEAVNERIAPPRRPSLEPLPRSQSPPAIPLASKPVKITPPPSRIGPPPTRVTNAIEPQTARIHVSPPPPTRTLNGLPPPPVRTVGVNDKLPLPRRRKVCDDDDSSSSEESAPTLRTADPSRAPIDELPDATHCSRRPPVSSSPFHRAAVPVPSGSNVVVAGDRVIVSYHHELRIYDLSRGVLGGRTVLDIKAFGLEWRKEARVTAMEFRAGTVDTDEVGRFLWCGTKEGHLFELDLVSLSMVRLRQVAHTHTVVRIMRYGRLMLTLDENGKVLVWQDYEDLASGGQQPRIARTTDKQGFVRMFGELLWMSAGSGSGTGTSGGGRGSVIRVYDILAPNSSARMVSTLESLGAITSGAILPSQPGKVYLGHEGGYVSIWIDGTDTFDSGRAVPTCIHTLKVASSDILALEGVLDRLWTGSRGGIIAAYDVGTGANVETAKEGGLDLVKKPWRLTNAWRAHGDLPVSRIFVDPFSMGKTQSLHVISVGRDEQLKFWDGLLGVDWIESELQKREQEFSTFRPLNILICSWNTDAQKPDALAGGKPANMTFLKDVLSSVDRPDIIAFGFQELIDLENRSLTAKTVLLGGKKNGDGSISDKVSRSYRLWHDALVHAVRIAMPIDDPYVVAHTDSLVGLFSCIFVRQRQKALLRDSAMKIVKRGMGGRYGNKGAIVARFVFDHTSLCFINCHLAAGQSHSRQRNQDIAAILEDGEALPRTEVPGALAYAGGGDGTMIMDHEIVFLNGDLNYRIDLRRDVIVKSIKEGDYAHLLNHDQLRKQSIIHPGFRLRTFSEAPIRFAPTYKYDRRSDEYDTSEKRRAPAWCDRILWHCRFPERVQTLHYKRYEVDVSDHRPISAAFAVTVKKHDDGAREAVRGEVQQQWKERETALLFDVREFYERQCIL